LLRIDVRLDRLDDSLASGWRAEVRDSVRQRSLLSQQQAYCQYKAHEASLHALSRRE
jgi:hypothetical protein